MASARLEDYYAALLEHFGPQRWWPARSRFEVIAGAILTQNTAWTNVEKALGELRRRGWLTPAGMRAAPRAELEQAIRSSGYWRQKAARLAAFLEYLDRRHGGSLRRMFRQEPRRLREELLALHGIGPETADSILLYAGGLPFFVIDAYTRRIAARHRLPGYDGAERQRPPAYEALQAAFEAALGPRAEVYNEFHALIVATGKHYCGKAVARCAACPLAALLPVSDTSLQLHAAAQPTRRTSDAGRRTARGVVARRAGGVGGRRGRHAPRQRNLIRNN